jgi:hypothetical protein
MELADPFLFRRVRILSVFPPQALDNVQQACCRFWQCSPEPVEGLRANGIGTGRLDRS